MFIARSSYDVATLAYLERGGLEKHEVIHLMHHIAGETLNIIHQCHSFLYCFIRICKNKILTDGAF